MLRANKQGQLAGSDTNASSPGFTWGRSGNVGSGTYLLNDTVPSNLAGRLVPVYGGLITEIFVAVENDTTCTFAIEKRSGAVFTEIATIELSSARISVGSYTVSVTRLDELVCKVKSGSSKNPVVGVIIKGDSA